MSTGSDDALRELADRVAREEGEDRKLIFDDVSTEIFGLGWRRLSREERARLAHEFLNGSP